MNSSEQRFFGASARVPASFDLGKLAVVLVLEYYDLALVTLHLYGEKLIVTVLLDIPSAQYAVIEPSRELLRSVLLRQSSYRDLLEAQLKTGSITVLDLLDSDSPAAFSIASTEFPRELLPDSEAFISHPLSVPDIERVFAPAGAVRTFWDFS